MGKRKIEVEPIGFRRPQEGCMKWVMWLLLISMVFSFVLASAYYGF